MTRIGTVIDGKYELLKKIGQGGMSVVYLAMDKRLNKQWAVKEIKKVASDKNKEIVVQSLLAEANLMKRLDHPSLPRIVDIIESNATIFIVMDYIEGEPLDKILTVNGAQPQELVIEWAKQLCDVLSYLHSQKPPIIYRDMKPANIMLKPEGNIKVIDFGIAREYKEQNTADTVSLGTKGYAAPEQFGGKGQTDARTDIYGLGVTLYHLVTGHNPCEPPYEIRPIREWDPTLSGGLERIIKKCTQLNPDDRYRNCAELLYDLNHYEEVDENYTRKQKGRLTVFFVAAAMSVLMLVSGVVFRTMMSYENSKNYDMLIERSFAGFDDNINSCKEAISIKGGDTRAYAKLLSTFSDNNRFGEAESSMFDHLYNTNKDYFNTAGEEFIDLNYQIGLTYFYLYSGGDNSFRTRILKAREYFATVVSSGMTDYENYSIAESYELIGSFYAQYVVNSTSVKEPTAESYENVLDSFNKCIDNVDGYESSEAAYIKLTIYQEIANFTNDFCKACAVTGVKKDVLTELLDRVNENADALLVTQQSSVQIRDAIISNRSQYAENIDRAYANADR